MNVENFPRGTFPAAALAEAAAALRRATFWLVVAVCICTAASLVTVVAALALVTLWIGTFS